MTGDSIKLNMNLLCEIVLKEEKICFSFFFLLSYTTQVALNEPVMILFRYREDWNKIWIKAQYIKKIST